MDGKQQSQQASLPQPISLIKTQSAQEHVTSNNISQYIEFFKDLIFDQNKIEHLAQNMFQKQRIRYYPDNFEEHLKAEIIKQHSNHEIFTVQIRVGHFKFQLNVLIDDIISQCHEFPSKKSRKESTIYIDKYGQQQIVVKCFPFAQQEQNKKISDVLGLVLMEFSLLKIASGIGVGPKLPRPWGFDIIIKANCIEFAMQMCLQIDQILKDHKDEYFINLKQKLQLLHYFQIVHLDIKPPNIMYSRALNSLVFIDFGFSKVIKQKKGFKSKTLFYGSVIYCVSDMLAILDSESSDKGWVDLYFNDAHCLDLSLKQIQTQINYNKSQSITLKDICERQPYLEQSFNYLPFSYQRFESSQLILKVKYALYSRNSQYFQRNKYLNVLLKHSQYFIRFILEFPYYKFYEKIFIFLTKTSISCGSDTNYKRRMQFKKQQILSYSSFLDTSETKQHVSLLMTKLQTSPESASVCLKTHQEKIILKIKNSKNQMIHDHQFQSIFNKQKMAKKAVPSILNKVCKFLDFRSCLLSLENKLKIWDFVQPLLPHSFQVNNILSSEYPQLEKCFKYILQYFLVNQDFYYEQMISSAVINLVIIDGIQLDQIVKVVDKVILFQKNSHKLALMYLRLFYLNNWTQEKLKYMGNLKYYDNIKNKLKTRLSLFQGGPKFIASITGFQISFKMNKSEEKFKFLYQKLRTLKQLEDIQTEEIMAFTFIYNCGINTETLQIALKLRQYGNFSFSNLDSLNIFHLKRFISVLPSSGLPQLSSKNYQKFIRHLGSLKLAQTFKVYYTAMLNRYFLEQDQSIMNNVLPKMQSLFIMRNLSEYSKVIFALEWFKKIIIRLISNNTSEIVSQYCNHIKKIVTINYLQNVVSFFKQISVLNILWLIDELFSFFLNFFCTNQQQLLQLRVCFIRLKQICQAFKSSCKHCYKAIIHKLTKIEIMLYLKERKYIQCIKLCYQRINAEISQQNKINIQWIAQYISWSVKNVQMLKNPSKHYNSCQIYNLFKLYNLYQYFFTSLETYMFLSQFTLIIQKNPQEYVYFHSQIWLTLANHPLKHYVNHYIKNICMFFSKFNIQQVTEILIEGGTQLKNKKLSYGCLFLAFLLNFKASDKLHLKAILIICKNVDFISPVARDFVMAQLMNYIFWDQNNFNRSRQKRRKLLTFASYLNLGRQTHLFIRHLGFRHLKSKHKNFNFLNTLYSKLKKIQRKLK